MTSSRQKIHGWVQYLGAIWASATTFVVPEDPGGSTATIFRAGRRLRVIRASEGDTKFSGGYVVTSYATATPAGGQATVTVAGTTLGAGAGALDVQWDTGEHQAKTWSVGAAGCDFTTVSAAVAVAVAGDVILVYPGTYAENPGAVPDGVTIHGIGNPTIGAGAGPVFTLASPATGEIGRLTGCMTIAATACLTAAAGGIWHVGPSVTLSGTMSGPWRIGRTIYLASGDAIAMYAPADGSLCAVSDGDELFSADKGVLVHCLTLGGTKRWGGELLPLGVLAIRSLTAATSNYFPVPFSGEASGIWIDQIGWSYRANATPAHDAGNNYGISITMLGTTTAELHNTNGAVVADEYHAVAVDQYFAMPADGSDPGVYNVMARVNFAKTGAPTDATGVAGNILARWIYA